MINDLYLMQQLPLSSVPLVCMIYTGRLPLASSCLLQCAGCRAVRYCRDGHWPQHHQLVYTQHGVPPWARAGGSLRRRGEKA